MEAVYNNKTGFTQVEFMVATLILIVGILALLQMVNVSISHGLLNQFRNESVSVADEAMRQQMAKGSNVGFDLISTTTNRKIIRRPFLSAFKNYSVITVGSNVTANTKEVDVTVSWTYKNMRYTQQAASLITKNP